MGQPRDRVLLLLLALITLAAFLPALGNDFVKWDDEATLSRNLAYRGLGWPQIEWMFTTYRPGGHYIPLTWLSFGLDYLLWGMNPTGYHLTNLLLHVAASLLFYLVSARLFARATVCSRNACRLGAAVAALFFAVHPLRVESVAWATERRDVLSGAFFLLSILTYLMAVEAERPRRRRLLVASVGSFLLALGAKSIVMPLPLILVLLDVYPLRRLPGHPSEWFGRATKALWIEKVPYLVLGAAGAVASYQAHIHGTSSPPASPLARVANAVYGLWFYPFKTALPGGLSPLYEAPAHLNPFEPRFLASAMAVAGVSGLVLLLRKRWSAGLALWLYYGLTLGPVSGLVSLGGPILVADRYSYLPGLGWAALVGVGVATLADRAARGAVRPALTRLAAAVVVVWLLWLTTLTWRQVEIWHDTITLWQYAVSVDPDCAQCHSYLGGTLIAQGAPLTGLWHLQRAVALRPDRTEFRAAMALALMKLGMWEEAAAEYRRVVAGAPGDVPARNNLAVALLGAGRPGEAVEQFRRALDLAPGLGPARLGLADAYRALGRIDLARGQAEALQDVDPQRPAPASRP